MAKNRAFRDDDEDLDLEELADESYDPEEDAMPTVHIVQRRIIEDPIRVEIEATIGEESTFIKFFRLNNPERFKFCFIDTLDPEMVLNTLETKFNDGLLEEVEDFFEKYGRSISDPVKFRLKLDAVVRATAGNGAML